MASARHLSDKLSTSNFAFGDRDQMVSPTIGRGAAPLGQWIVPAVYALIGLYVFLKPGVLTWG